jgi:hypothetical protein
MPNVPHLSTYLKTLTSCSVEAEKRAFFHTPEYHNRMEAIEAQLQQGSTVGSNIDSRTKSGINQVIESELIIIQKEHRDKRDTITHESVTAKIAIFSPILTEYPLSHPDRVVHIVPVSSLSKEEIKDPAIDVRSTFYYPLINL